MKEKFVIKEKRWGENEPDKTLRNKSSFSL